MKRRIIYFTNGSIGDFLMTIFLMENIYGSQHENTLLYVVTPRNKKIFDELASCYPYIHITEAGIRTPRSLIGLLSLSRFLCTKNSIVTMPTPGVLPTRTKIAARLLSLMPHSKAFGFIDDKKWTPYFYTTTLLFDTSKLYFETIKDIVRILGYAITKNAPTLRRMRSGGVGVLKKYQLTKNNYIVIHPYGSSAGRSLSNSDLMWLIKYLRISCPQYNIVLTGSSKDKEKIEEILANKGYDSVINTAGALSMTELCEVIDAAHLYIGVDTGITHLSSVLCKKSIVIANNGTPYWLPYYNPNAVILYNISECTHYIHEGREHLESCRGERIRCLGNVPRSVIADSIIKHIDG